MGVVVRRGREGTPDSLVTRSGHFTTTAPEEEWDGLSDLHRRGTAHSRATAVPQVLLVWLIHIPALPSEPGAGWGDAHTSNSPSEGSDLASPEWLGKAGVGV